MNPPEDPLKPVAYDSQGRPLYAHPPTEEPETIAPQQVHFSRATDPVKPEISETTKAKHDESIRQYPQLNLSESEFIISAVRRHPIGLFIPTLLAAFLIIIVLVGMAAYPGIANSIEVSNPGATIPGVGDIMLVGSLLLALFAIGGYVAVWVYLNNKFFLTNESVIQEIQTSLFSKNEQTVSLSNIEDASFTQKGIIQTLLDYGSIRLSTQGDETTYRFQYVSNPKRQIALLNNAVEAFKNGRPVED
jgi:uncharacterized membrane protein YdbT with pleckstrin-like domain